MTKLTIAFTIVWAVIFSLSCLLDCRSHVAYNWGPWIDFQEHCNKNETGLDEALTVSDFLIDLVILVMPLPMVSSPQRYEMPRCLSAARCGNSKCRFKSGLACA